MRSAALFVFVAVTLLALGASAAVGDTPAPTTATAVAVNATAANATAANATSNTATTASIMMASGMLRISGDLWKSVVGSAANTSITTSMNMAAATSTALYLNVPVSTVMVTSLSLGSLIISYNITGNSTFLTQLAIRTAAPSTTLSGPTTTVVVNATWMAPLIEIYSHLTSPVQLALMSSNMTKPFSLPTPVRPSDMPSIMPSGLPSNMPSDMPSSLPSNMPSDMPSNLPSGMPSDMPSDMPSGMPSDMPSGMPSDMPSGMPSDLPTGLPPTTGGNTTNSNATAIYVATGMLRISGDGWANIVGPNAPATSAASAKVAALSSVAMLLAVSPSLVTITSLSVGSLVVQYTVSGNASTLATAYMAMQLMTSMSANTANPAWMTSLVQLFAKFNGTATLLLLNSTVAMPAGFPTGGLPPSATTSQRPITEISRTGTKAPQKTDGPAAPTTFSPRPATTTFPTVRPTNPVKPTEAPRPTNASVPTQSLPPRTDAPKTNGPQPTLLPPRTVEPGDKTDKPSMPDGTITTTGMIRVSGDSWANAVGPNANATLAASVKAAALVSTAAFLGVPTSAVVVTSLSVGSLIISYTVTGNATALISAYQNSVATATSANTAWMRSLTEVYTKANPNSGAALSLLNFSLTKPAGIPDAPPATVTAFPTQRFTAAPSDDKPTTGPAPTRSPSGTPSTKAPTSCSLPILKLRGNYTFGVSDMIRIGSDVSSVALSCNVPLRFTWTVGGTTVQGSSFVAAAGSLKPGTYDGQVTVSFASTTGTVTGDATTASAYFTVIITVPRPTVTINGGDRQVSVGAALTFAATGTSISSVAWHCQSDRVTCNFTVSTIGVMQTATLATGFAAAGTYKVAVVATNAAGATATATVTVRVVDTAVNNVQLQTSASSTVYVGRPIVVVAQAADGSQYAWSATDGTTKNGGSVATFKPTATGTFNVTVTATSKSNVVGTASLSFTILALPTGTLTVTSADSPIVGGTSPLVFTLSQWTGPSTATFRFGYLQYGEWNSLSDDFNTATSQTYTAPLVLADRSMIFAAQAKMGDIRLDPITFTLALTAPANKTAAIADRQKVMQDAAAAKDISTVLRAAQDVADASNTSSSTSSSGSSAAAASSAAATSAVAAVASVVTSTMSSTQKGSAVDVLATAVSDSGKKVDTDTQKQVAKALKAVLANASTSAASSSDAVDTTTRAAAMLALISSVNATTMANDTSNRDSRQQLARDLAITVAAQLPVGQSSTIKSNDMNITAVKAAVSAAVATALNTSAGSISIPLDALASAMKANPAVVAQSGTNVAVSATSHATNPVPSAAPPAGTTLNGSAIMEFDATAAGANFSSLSSPITLRIRTNASAGQKPSCVYFDASTNSWSTAGVVTTDYNAADQTVGCNTTHLSMFAAAASASTTPGTANANTPAASDDNSNNALYAGVGVGAAIVLVAGVAIVRRQRNASRQAKSSGEVFMQPLNQNEPQLQYQMVERAPAPKHVERSAFQDL